MSFIQQCASIAKKRRRRVQTKEGYLALIVKLLIIIAICWLTFTQVFLLMQAPNNDMFPAIKAGDLTLSYRLQPEYEKDDVVIFEQDGKLRIGRIAALEEDVINIDETGAYTVNGTPQSGEILFLTFPESFQDYPYRVKAGEVFILCDYRTQVEDSREFGPIQLSAIKGRVISILRRREL